MKKLSLLFRSTTAKNYSSTLEKCKCIYPGGRRKNVEMARFDLSGGPLMVSDRWSLLSLSGNPVAGN
jgi:hypothetical protein